MFYMKNQGDYLKSFIFKVFLISGLVWSLVACTQEATEDQVTPMAEEYFATLQANDFEKLLTFYHPDFFNLHSAPEWIARLENIREQLGQIQSVKLKQSQVNTVLTGRRFIYEYSVKYEKGFAKEMVLFFQEINQQDIKVQMHKIDSKLLK